MTDGPQLPAGLVARARAAARPGWAPPPTRDAATVVLLRDAPGPEGGVEAYLLRRVRSMAFAAGMYVFPGGSVDPRDAALPDALWAGPPPAEWAGPLSADDQLARALVCAAVRETFEESGVLLAGPSPDAVVADTRDESWEADRLALLDRTLSLSELLARRQLVLRADLLRAWAHWITPELEERRFDTRFFVAALPPGQRTRDVGGEADRVAWLPPARALERQYAGEIAMLPPTMTTLSELAPHASVTEVLTAAADRVPRPILPRIVVGERDDDIRLLFPGDDGYDRGTGTDG